MKLFTRCILTSQSLVLSYKHLNCIHTYLLKLKNKADIQVHERKLYKLKMIYFYKRRFEHFTRVIKYKLYK